MTQKIYQQLMDYLDGDTQRPRGAGVGMLGGRRACAAACESDDAHPGDKAAARVSVAAYGKVSKVLCALPDTASKVDVNT